MLLSGAQMVIEELKKVDTKVIFGQCGHSVLAILNAIKPSGIKFISFRHEQCAAHAADAYARLTGKPGVVVTHTGPGLLNAAHAVASAAMDSVPLIVLSGDVQTYYHGFGPHQELKMHADADQTSVYRPFVKKAWQVQDVNLIPKIVCRALNIATSGRPGPVLISLPQDIAAKRADVEILDPHVWGIGETKPSGDHRAVAKAVEILIEAKKPVIFAGGGVLMAKASPELLQIAEYLGIPVVTTVQGKAAIAEDHLLSVGNTGFWGTIAGNNLVNQADAILAVGTRFAEIDCSFWDPKYTFRIPPTKLIHVDIDYEEIGRNYPAEVGIQGDAKVVLKQIFELMKQKTTQRDWKNSERIKEVRKMLASQDVEKDAKRNSNAKPIEIGRVMKELRKILPRDGIIVCDVGWSKSGVSQHLPIYTPGTHIAPGGMAGMGFGPGAAVGAKVAAPDKHVVAVIGDGAFSSTSSAVITAVEQGIKVIWLILNNYGYCSVKVIQKQFFNEVFATEHLNEQNQSYNPDFTKLAESYGAIGERIDDPSELAEALKRAFASDKPYVLDVAISRELGVVQAGDWALGLTDNAG